MCKPESRLRRHSTSDLIARKALYIGDGYRAKNSEMGPIGLPFARAGNINGGFRFDGADLLDGSNVPKAGGKVSQPSDIVFTSKGTVGRFAFVRPETPKFVYSPQLCFWRVLDSSVIDARFLFSWMHGFEFLNQVQRVKGLTDMADYVSLSDQRRMHITLPPLEEQKSISSMLSAYDDLIENNTRRIKILEDMAQMIYREWFVNFRFPGHEKVPMVDSDLGPIPKGWTIRRVENFGAVVTGKTPSTERPEFYGLEVPFIKTPDMHGNLFCVAAADYLSTEGAESQRNKTIWPNSIMVNCIGALAGSVSISTRPSQTNQQINTVVLNDQLDREFLYLSLTALRGALRQIGSNGATMINVNKRKFEGLAMVTPPPGIVRSFHDLTYTMFEEVRNLQTRTINLRTTRDLLLPKLISGEIPVEAADDTAAGLMEEIVLHA